MVRIENFGEELESREKDDSSRFGVSQKFQHPLQLICSGPFFCDGTKPLKNFDICVDQIDEGPRAK